MKQRFGAVLCLILGAALIMGGLGSGDGTAGSVVPTACGATVPVGVVTNPGTCPTGSIDVTEVTDLTADPGADTPPSYHLTVSSTGPNVCNLPPSGTSLDVADAGTATFSGLYVYQSADTTNQNLCQYTITETPVTGFTTAFAPTAPYSFIYVPTLVRRAGARANALSGPSPLAVTVTNTAIAPSTTASAPPSTTTSASPSTTSAPSTTSGSSGVSVTASAITTPAGTPSASASSVLANTGPRSSIRLSLIAGIALFTLGLVLLVAGRRRPRRRHS